MCVLFKKKQEAQYLVHAIQQAQVVDLFINFIFLYKKQVETSSLH